MLHLSTVEWWLIANTAMILVLAVSFVGLWLKHKHTLQNLQAALSLLKQSQNALTSSTVGMGQRLNQLSGKVQLGKHMQHTNADDNTLAQATRLVELGASANDLVDSCGVPRAEAELLVSMRQQSQPFSQS